MVTRPSLSLVRVLSDSLLPPDAPSSSPAPTPSITLRGTSPANLWSTSRRFCQPWYQRAPRSAKTSLCVAQRTCRINPEGTTYEGRQTQLPALFDHSFCTVYGPTFLVCQAQMSPISPF